MQKRNFAKKLKTKFLLIFVVIIAVVASFFVYFSTPISLLPMYSKATNITPANTTQLEQHIKSAIINIGDEFFYNIDKNSLHYQIFVTTDSSFDIYSFYEVAGKKAGLTEINRDSNYADWEALVFAHFNNIWIPQNVTGVEVLDESIPYQAELIAQLVKQPNPTTRIIVLFQGSANFSEE